MIILCIADTCLILKGDYLDDLKYKPFILSDLCTKQSVLNVVNVEEVILHNHFRFFSENNLVDATSDALIIVFNQYHKTNTLGRLTFDAMNHSAELELLNNARDRVVDILDRFVFVYFQVRLLYNSGINLHASAIHWNNRAILFSAPAGTGKTTQAKLWQKYTHAKLFNGDRPALTMKDNKCLAHGTPWSGTDPVYINCSYLVGAIVLVEQAETNSVVRLSPQEALSLLMPRMFIPYYSEKLTSMALDIVSEIIETVPIFRLQCKADKGAVDILKEQLSLLYE